jgi:hypothetical protein
MCWYVYIATSEPLTEVLLTEDLPKTGERPPPLHFQQVGEKEMQCYSSLFKHKHLYYVGSCTGCSCGLKAYDRLYWTKTVDEAEKAELLEVNASPIAFLAFLKNYTQKEPLEMYAVYETECWHSPLHHVAIPIHQNAHNDFVQLKTRQFYTFYSE